MNNDKIMEYKKRSGTVALTKGTYPITILFMKMEV